MTIPNHQEINRRPTHPAAILREDFLPDYGLTVSMLAKRLGVSRQSVNELLLERRAMSAKMAILLVCFVWPFTGVLVEWAARGGLVGCHSSTQG